MAKLGDFVQSADWAKEKHVPVIDLPAEMKAGQAFDVTVSVGKQIPHPNTTEHFINWITLYYKPTDGKIVCLGKIEFTAHGESVEGANKGPAYCDPIGHFRIKLQKDGTLLAMSYCNIHGLWESSVEVKVS